MATGYTSNKLLKEYSSDTETTLRARLNDQLNQVSEQFISKLDRTIGLADGESEKELIESLKAFEIQEEHSFWIDEIESCTRSLPEQVELFQNDSHYSTRENSGFIVNAGKTVKRVARVLGRGRVKTQNGVRVLFKKEIKKWEYPKRELPFKTLVQNELLALKVVLYQFEHLNNRFHARVLDDVYKWSVYQKNEKDEESAYDQPLSELLSELKVDFEQSIENLRESFGELLSDIKKEIARKTEVAGTIELRSGEFDHEIIQARISGIRQKLREIHVNWNKGIEQLSNRSETLLYKADFKESLRSRGEETIQTINEQFSKLEDGAHSRLEKLIAKGAEHLSADKSISKKELTKICTDISDSVEAHVQKRLVSPVMDAIDEHRLSGILDEYTEKILRIAATQPEKTLLLEHVDLQADYPEFDSMEVEWQKIIRRMLNDYIVNELQSEKVKPESSLAALVDYYKEIAQIVDTNLDMVEEVTREEELKPIEIASQGMERAQTKLEETSQHIDKIRGELTGKITDQNEKLLSELNGFLNKDDFGGVKWIETQLRVRQSAGGWKTKWTVFWANTVDRMDLFRRFVLRKYKSWSDKIRVFLGQDTEDTLSSEKINLATYLYETDEKFKELPFIYRRLFDFHRDIDRSFYINNPVHFDTAKKALGLWKEGFPSSLAIIGEKGSGKNTLNRFLAEEEFSEKNYRLQIEKTLWKEEDIIERIAKLMGVGTAKTTSDLIEKINTKRKGSVIVIENIQNCFVRAMSGYKAIKALLSIIAETRGTVFWVISSSRYAWNFLQVYLKIGEHFSHSVSTDKLSATEIQSLIMKRQKASGYQLRFLPAGDTEKSRTYRKFLDDDLAQQEYLKELYFDKLTSMAEGNATVAIIYWVRSIIEFNENELSVQSLDMGGVELLSNLEPNSLFALSSFVLHDALTAKELAISLHTSPSEAEMLISRLNTSGLLIKKENYYFLNQLIYRQVVRVLKNKNIVH